MLSGLAHTCCLLGWELGPPLYVAVCVLLSFPCSCSPSPVVEAQFLYIRESMKLAELLPVGVEFHFVLLPHEGMQQFNGIMVSALNQC